MKMQKVFKYLLLSLALAAVSCTSLFAAEYESLLGRWQRTDGGYIL